MNLNRNKKYKIKFITNTNINFNQLSSKDKERLENRTQEKLSIYGLSNLDELVQIHLTNMKKNCIKFLIFMSLFISGQ